MKKVLYIEDEPDQIKVVGDRLEASGYGFISAADGEEGIRKAQEEKPDLILLDIFLPKIKGFDVCKRLKELPETSDIPIIVITASGVEYIDAQSKAAGASDCIKKPYEAKELILKIEQLLKE